MAYTSRDKSTKKSENGFGVFSANHLSIICPSLGSNCCSVARCFISETFTCTTSGPASPKWMGRASFKTPRLLLKWHSYILTQQVLRTYLVHR